ncbi:AcrR family transcriptional regulator [Arthrobacter stackebrandtii]|uniref:AcrR family transcriptional regulator n=1 Tax=Arthrobacter stackebrandtii TaxID=272161 RepID=A0ABS4YXQ7_9MICC|nr:TetR/AcrR family transcriptional regulator [Arthrobacter stackebrandtii]MBP2413591.1 AcrR family transcriptional regulator [Arthrobacter stackebrandtii]PYH00586.1 TetR family transcriptional regulator [Arthrobacter stackebrandtii]
MTQTPRERARAQTMDDILDIGRTHLAVHGAAGLSLRAVARDLGVVSSAVYRYVKNRDELLTLLVVDGYTALGDAVDGALSGVAADDFPAQFRMLGRAVREWALAEPAHYGLLFGSPVPGYEAPAEQTTGPGTRVVVRLVQILDQAHGAAVASGAQSGVGQSAGESPPGGGVSAVLADSFAAIRAEMGISLPDGLLARGVMVWAALFGMVSFEVFGQYGPGTFGDPASLFELQLEALGETVGL